MGRLKRWLSKRRALREAQELVARSSEGNTVDVADNDVRRLKLRIVGRGNVVRIGRLLGGGELRIDVFGDGNEIVIGDDVAVGASLAIGAGADHANFGPVHNCRIAIGRGSSFERARLLTLNSNASFAIGENCMVAFNVELYHTDAHPVYELGGDTPINRVRELRIGDHVWIGANATLLKNTHVADGSIVAWGSVVSGRFTEPNCVIAGNPARVVKRGVCWKPGDSHYIENET